MGAIRKGNNSASFTINVPKERRPKQSSFEIRYSPTLAGAMVDALPYLTSYPYGCTEQTLSRFLPTVITQNILKRMGLDLKSIQTKRVNLNSQELGDSEARAAQWKQKSWHKEPNPVFDEDKVAEMVRAGLLRLYSMQISDGGWGWFSGWRERSQPHTTAYVLHGLLLAQESGLEVRQDIINRGVDWLKK